MSQIADKDVAEKPDADDAHKNKGLYAAILGSIGVVYGDIGTSPLYAFREALRPIAYDGVTQEEVIGLTSLMIWSLTIIVTFKYITLLLRADNDGEGGTLSLLALLMKTAGTHRSVLIVLGLIGAALFLGDAMITPALSVLSAVEGLKLVTPEMDAFIIPISVGILIGLFAIQSHGTGTVAKFSDRSPRSGSSSWALQASFILLTTSAFSLPSTRGTRSSFWRMKVFMALSCSARCS